MYLIFFLWDCFLGKFKIGYISTVLCHVPVNFLQVCARQVDIKVD